MRARDEAEAQLAIDRAEVDLARARLDKTRITAPFAGVVGLREISVGNYVEPGQDLVNLEDIEPIKVDFPVPERALSAVEVGQAIEVTVDRLARTGPSRARSTPSTRRSTRRAAASRSAPPSTTRSACCAPACSPRCG